MQSKSKLVICALEQFLVGMEKLSQKRVDYFLATSFWQDSSNSSIYYVLSEKEQILKILSRDQGPRNQTLYSPLNGIRLLNNTRQESGTKKLNWQELDSLLYMMGVTSSLLITMKENRSLDMGLLSAR